MFFIFSESYKGELENRRQTDPKGINRLERQRVKLEKKKTDPGVQKIRHSSSRSFLARVIVTPHVAETTGDLAR